MWGCYKSVPKSAPLGTCAPPPPPQERQLQLEEERLKKKAGMSHRDRVKEFNDYLAALSVGGIGGWGGTLVPSKLPGRALGEWHRCGAVRREHSPRLGPSARGIRGAALAVLPLAPGPVCACPCL